MSELSVTSHVPRDLLQSAAMFKNERRVVWEYVSNSLDYVDAGTNPVIEVTIQPRMKRIVISDNGRGMDWDGLQNFFVMHGENQDRSSGRTVRGLFGTGKSAAFGIADSLTIVTTRNGSRCKVTLTRQMLETTELIDRVPVEVIERSVPTSEANGTVIVIDGIQLRTIDKGSVIADIERNIARRKGTATISVNGQLCVFTEPSVHKELRFAPDEAAPDELRACELVIKISESPLDNDLRGISIYANGALLETTLLGAERKDLSEYIFGEIDVPALSSNTQTPSAFDASRSRTLNPANPLVQAIHGFVGHKIEVVLAELRSERNERKSLEESKRLQEEANKIEGIINADFKEFRKQIQKARAFDGDGNDLGPLGSPKEDHRDEDGSPGMLFGGNESASVLDNFGDVGTTGSGDSSKEGPPRRLNPTIREDSTGDPIGRSEPTTRKPSPQGGFSVEFNNHGASNFRATYQPERRTIFINLDHPQIALARKDRTPDDPIFRRLAYEVAFSEYAIALAFELANEHEYNDPVEPITDVRETLNRVARAAAGLYAE